MPRGDYRDAGAGLHAATKRVGHSFVELVGSVRASCSASAHGKGTRTCSRTFIATAGLIMPWVTCASAPVLAGADASRRTHTPSRRGHLSAHYQRLSRDTAATPSRHKPVARRSAPAPPGRPAAAGNTTPHAAEPARCRKCATHSATAVVATTLRHAGGRSAARSGSRDVAVVRSCVAASACAGEDRALGWSQSVKWVQRWRGGAAPLYGFTRASVATGGGTSALAPAR